MLQEYSEEENTNRFFIYVNFGGPQGNVTCFENEFVRLVDASCKYYTFGSNPTLWERQIGSTHIEVYGFGIHKALRVEYVPGGGHFERQEDAFWMYNDKVANKEYHIRNHNCVTAVSIVIHELLPDFPSNLTAPWFLNSHLKQHGFKTKTYTTNEGSPKITQDKSTRLPILQETSEFQDGGKDSGTIIDDIIGKIDAYIKNRESKWCRYGDVISFFSSSFQYKSSAIKVSAAKKLRKCIVGNYKFQSFNDDECGALLEKGSSLEKMFNSCKHRLPQFLCDTIVNGFLKLQDRQQEELTQQLDLYDSVKPQSFF